jgi:hypothetical protein
MENYKKTDKKVFFNIFSNSVTTIKEIEKDYNYIEWSCALCGADIKINVDNAFVMKDYCCPKCAEAQDSNFIDESILKSSIKFSKHCKKLFRKEQKEFIKHRKGDTNPGRRHEFFED